MEYTLHKGASFERAMADFDEEMQDCLKRLLARLQQDPLKDSARLIGTRHLRRRRLAVAGQHYRVIYALDERLAALVVIDVNRRNARTYRLKRLRPLDDEADEVLADLRARRWER